MLLLTESFKILGTVNLYDKAGINALWLHFRKAFDCGSFLRLLINLEELLTFGRRRMRINGFPAKKALRLNVDESLTKWTELASGDLAGFRSRICTVRVRHYEPPQHPFI